MAVSSARGDKGAIKTCLDYSCCPWILHLLLVWPFNPSGLGSQFSEAMPPYVCLCLMSPTLLDWQDNSERKVELRLATSVIQIRKVRLGGGMWLVWGHGSGERRSRPEPRYSDCASAVTCWVYLQQPTTGLPLVPYVWAHLPTYVYSYAE